MNYGTQTGAIHIITCQLLKDSRRTQVLTLFMSTFMILVVVVILVVYFLFLLKLQVH